MLTVSMSGPALLAGPAPVAQVQSLCFVHVGPEDKPMPAFCVVKPGTAPAADSTAAEAVAVTARGWQALIGALHTAPPADPAQPADFGRYRVRSMPPAPDQLVTPQRMRQLGLILQQHAACCGVAGPALIDRLLRRLPP